METQPLAEGTFVLTGMARLAYSISEVETLIGLSRSSLYRLIAAGKLKTVLHGRRRLVPARELESLL
ncbi:MAG TPA: helix-turn-helix domain-containing protein [Steroidobacteraceae bacterium]|nr:helix-turn-helix domain-containing protein [Steroidobacteraceae bacterium]